MPRGKTGFSRTGLKFLGALVVLAGLVWLYSVLKNALPAASTATKAPERAAVKPLREKPTPVGALPGAARTSAPGEESASPPVPAETTTSTAPSNPPSRVEMRIPGVHHLGRHHCDGELIFTDKDFSFTCPSDSFTVERSMVAKLDNNGVLLVSGEKYHFDVAGYDKTGVQILFSEWLER
jgi:hypothetical protein